MDTCYYCNRNASATWMTTDNRPTCRYCTLDLNYERMHQGIAMLQHPFHHIPVRVAVQAHGEPAFVGHVGGREEALIALEFGVK